MSAAATPGPWKVEPSPEDLNARVYGPRNALVAVVWSGGARSLDVAVANANVIAAAPELLAALEALMGAFGGVTTHAQQVHWNAAKAAIAKAKGGAA